MIRLAADENFSKVGRHVPMNTAIDEILLLIECSSDGEWEGQVRYLPLR